jgi:hypothetical protein
MQAAICRQGLAGTATCSVVAACGQRKHYLLLDRSHVLGHAVTVKANAIQLWIPVHKKALQGEHTVARSQALAAVRKPTPAQQ